MSITPTAPVAFIFILSEGKFVAERAEVDGPFVHATGHWERTNGSHTLRGDRIRRTWPASRIKSIRWSGP